MTEISIGGRLYRINALAGDGEWTAHAERVDTGDRYGLDWSGTSEADAVDRVARWLNWQYEHALALEALQVAERAFHRTIAGSAFASPTEGPTALELQKESLERVEAARVRLDGIRANKPDL